MTDEQKYKAALQAVVALYTDNPYVPSTSDYNQGLVEGTRLAGLIAIEALAKDGPK